VLPTHLPSATPWVVAVLVGFNVTAMLAALIVSLRDTPPSERARIIKALAELFRRW